jgi:ABC-type transport system involved in multi-copper enzyme maturation permease subunit
MIAPVLHQEMLLGGRRNQLHVFRWVYAGWLVLVLLVYFLVFMSEEMSLASARRFGGVVSDRHASAPEVVGSRFASFFVWQQSLFVFLAVPIFVAGAIVDEKRQGTLQYLLLSEVEPRHIVLGKLLGRVGVVLMWLLAGLPLFACLAGFGGVEPITMLFLAVGLMMPIFGIAALSLLASVWCKDTRDAVIAVYLVVLAGAIGEYLLGGPFLYLNPLWVLEPAWGAAGSLDLATAGTRLVAASLVWMLFGLVCLGLATFLLIPAYRREMEGLRPERAQWYLEDREPMDDQPVRWREQHIEGLALNATMRRFPQWLAILLVGLASTIASLAILYYSLIPGATVAELLQALLQLNVRKVASLMPTASNGFLLLSVIAMLTASQVVGARCAGALVQERERGTLEAVLLTPMTARSIIHGKLWGIMNASIYYLLAYAAPAVALSVFAGPLALTYTIAWLAATVLAMYFIGSVGLWCSVRAKTAWRSMIQTEFIGYLGGLAIYVVSTPAIIIIVYLLILMVLFVDFALGTNFASLCFSDMKYFLRVLYFASAGSLVVIFWFLSRVFLKSAQRWIADRERTRHVFDEPIYRRSRSHPSYHDVRNR